MEKYYQIKVAFKVENDKGKIKEEKIIYLVKDTGCVEAQAAITKYLTDQGENEFEVKEVKESNISLVI